MLADVPLSQVLKHLDYLLGSGEDRVGFDRIMMEQSCRGIERLVQPSKFEAAMKQHGHVKYD